MIRADHPILREQMVKSAKRQIRRLKSTPPKKLPALQRRRIEVALPRESKMTQPLIAAVMGVSLSAANRAQKAYEHGGRKRENMTQAEEKPSAHALCQGRESRRNFEHSRSRGGP